jgi:uncharacterized protein
MAMRPMAFSERGVCRPTVSLRALLHGESPEIVGTADVDTPTYTEEILRSGFPGIRDLPERARHLQLDSYIARILERELPENGVSVRRPGALRAWLSAYAAATATNAAYSTILDAATPGEGEKPARQTAAAYREHLQRIFVLDPLPAWIPAFAPLKRLTYTPKHHLVDPAIAARLVGVDKAGLLRGEGSRASAVTGTWLGALFESLVTQQRGERPRCQAPQLAPAADRRQIGRPDSALHRQIRLPQTRWRGGRPARTPGTVKWNRFFPAPS